MEGLGQVANNLEVRVAMLEAKAGSQSLQRYAEILLSRVENLEAAGLVEFARSLSSRVDSIEAAAPGGPLEGLASSLSSRVDALESVTPGSPSGNKKGKERSASFEAMEAHCKEIENYNKGLIDRVASLEAGIPAGAATSVGEAPITEQIEVIASSLRKRVENLEYQQLIKATMTEERRTHPIASDSASLQEQLAEVELRRRALEMELAEYKLGQKSENVQKVDNTEQLSLLEKERQEAMAQTREVQAKLQSQLAIAMASEQRKQEVEKLNADLHVRVGSLEANIANMLSVEQRNQELEQSNAQLAQLIKTLETKPASPGEADAKYDSMQRQLAAMEMEKRAIQTEFSKFQQQQGAKDIELTQALAQVQEMKDAQSILTSQLKEFQEQAKQAEDAFNALKLNSDASEEKELLRKENQQLQQELQLAYTSQKRDASTSPQKDQEKKQLEQENATLKAQKDQEKKQLEQENATLKARLSEVERRFQQTVEDKRLVEIKIEALTKEQAVQALQPKSPGRTITPSLVRSASGNPASVRMANVISTASVKTTEISPSVSSFLSSVAAPTSKTPIRAKELSPSKSMPLSIKSPTKSTPDKQGYAYDPFASPKGSVVPAIPATEGSLRSRSLVPNSGRTSAAQSTSPARLAATIQPPSVRPATIQPQIQAPLTYNSLLARAQANSSPGRRQQVQQVQRATSNGQIQGGSIIPPPPSLGMIV